MSYRVILKHDPLWRALDWAKQNCPSYITNSVCEDSIGMGNYAGAVNYTIEYHFGNESDAMIFALRWI